MKGGETVKKVLFITLAAVLALGVSLVGCGGETVPPGGPDSIKVGMVREVDHADLAVFDWIAGGPVYRWFIDKVNDEGGIYLSEYAESVEIELVKRTFDMTNWATLGEQTDALIYTDEVDFVWAPTSTDSIYTMAPICNAGSTLLTTMEGGASKMVWESESYLDNWPYVWISLSFANWYELAVVQEMLASELGRDPVAYVTHIGGLGAEHGQEYLQEAQNVFGAENVIDPGAHAFSIDVTAAQTIIGDAASALGDPAAPNYDIFCAFTYPSNVDALTQAAIDLNFNPPAMLFGPGANFGYYPYNFGDDAQGIVTPPGDGRLADGILCFAVSTPETTIAVGTPTMSMADLYTELAAQLDADVASGACLIPLPGVLLLDYWGIPCYTAALEMWKYAVEDVGELDSAAIRNVLASYSPANPAQTVFGDTWFTVFGADPVTGQPNQSGGGVMDYMCHTGEIGQWQLAGGTSMMEIVGYDGITDDLPNYCVTGDFKFPMTDQWFWLVND
jgi:hypothetical protein